MRYLFIILAMSLLACKNIKKKFETPAPVVSTEKLDSVAVAPTNNVVKPVIFETAFMKGTTEKVNNKTVSLFGVNIGKLKVPTGHLIACDPTLMEEYARPFTQVFPTGEFPVQVALAKLENDETIAFARVYFSDAPVVKWEVALLKEEEPIGVFDDEKHGYIVDAGVACFMDEGALKKIDVTAFHSLDSDLYQQMNKHYRNTWRYTMYNAGEYNFAAFSAGVGDGRYSTYIGFDAAGKPCRLLTDFNLFEWKTK